MTMTRAETWLKQADAALTIEPITREAVAVSRKYIELALEALRAEVEREKNCDHEPWIGQYCKKCDLIWKDKDHA